MSELNIGEIVHQIQNSVKINKDDFDALISFLAKELSKNNESVSDENIELVSENIENKYYSKNQIQEFLKQEIQKQTMNNSNSSNSDNFQTILTKISNNKELSDPGGNIKFSKRQLGFLRKIFYMNMTQNYLSALKWYMTDDLIKNQNNFNFIIEDSFKKIFTQIQELKNYAHDSESWIKKIEIELNEQNSKLDEHHSKLDEHHSKLDEHHSKLDEHHSKLDEHHSKLDEHHSKLDTSRYQLDFLYRKIEELSSKLDENEIHGHLISNLIAEKSNTLEDVTKLNFNINNEILYFLHIPKTAGTSFIDFLDNYYDDSQICKEHDWQELLSILPQNFSPKLVHGHFSFGLHRVLPKKPLYITMLRNPIDRTISDYYQSIRTKNMGAETDFFKNSDLEDLVTNESTKWRFTNNQLKHIVSDLDPTDLIHSTDEKLVDEFSRFLVADFKSPSTSNTELLKQAKKNLEDFAFVGITERFEESMQLLCYTFGWKPFQSTPQLNVSPSKSLQGNMSAKTLNSIKNCNLADLELYEYALNSFESKYSTMITNLMKKYYLPSLSHLSFKKLVNALLEKHYEENFWASTTINSIEYTFDKSLNGTGWYSREKQDKKYYRWMGPATSSVIDFPKLDNKDKIIQFHVVDYMSEDTARNMKLEVNDKQILLNIIDENTESHELTFEGKILGKSFNTSNKFTRLKFTVDKTYDPKFQQKITSDLRKVSVAIDSITIK